MDCGGVNKEASHYVTVELQNPFDYKGLPTVDEMQAWANSAIVRTDHGAIKKLPKDMSVVIRVVDDDESAQLNQSYRQKQGSTNILSFENEVPEYMADIPELLASHNAHLGDLVICEPLVAQEATEQGKQIKSHWAHLIIHGVLHLQSYDHIDHDDAIEMEKIEIRVMKQLGFDNPYL